MPVDVTWMYGNRVILTVHHGRVSSQELIESIDETRRLVAEGQVPVHNLVDSSLAEGRIEMDIADLRRIVPRAAEGTGWMVIIQPRTLERFFTALGMQLSGAKYRFFPDRQAAIDFLLEQDPTLHDVIR